MSAIFTASADSERAHRSRVDRDHRVGADEEPAPQVILAPRYCDQRHAVVPDRMRAAQQGQVASQPVSAQTAGSQQSGIRIHPLLVVIVVVREHPEWGLDVALPGFHALPDGEYGDD